MSENNKRNNKKIVLIIIAVLLILGGSGIIGFHFYNDRKAEEGNQEISSAVSSTTAVHIEDNRIENPIDFKALQKKNSDIYAWINVPGTKVDYPVVQSPDSDEFYLKHSATDKSWAASGAIYTELVNSKTFNDRVTVIYGHNGYSDTMFTTLHNFEKKDVFDKNEYFVIYTPSSRLTYKIVSSFKYDDRHIMSSFDFQNDQVFLDFLNMIQNPESGNKSVRENLGRELTTDDRVVVLSTCITNQKSNRYLVCGVLEKNEKTY